MSNIIEIIKEDMPKLKRKFTSINKNVDKIIYKHLKIVFERISYVGILHLPEALIKSAFPFIRFFISAKFCKKTRAKYGLD